MLVLLTEVGGAELMMNVKTKVVSQRKYSKGWAILSEAGMRTTRRKMRERLAGDAYWRGS